MHPIDLPRLSDRFQFDGAIRSRTWDWLVALRRRLNIDLEIVDEAQTPLLWRGLGPPVATEVKALLASGAPGLRLAISAALRTRTPQAASIDGIQTMSLHLTSGGVVSGALVLARRTADSGTAERARGELELIGFWLCTAIEAHLLSQPAAEGDLDRLASLSRILADAAARGSDREIVATFAETLAVWHDLEVYGYVETAAGEFAREVSLAGAQPFASPAVIPPTAVPEGGQVTRIVAPDVERLGFATAHDLIATRFGGGPGSWLIAVCGVLGAHDVTRLGVYLALLDQSIARAMDASMAHVVTAVSKQLIDDAGRPEEQAGRAVEDMQERLNMSSAALTVTTAAGAPLVRVGSAPAQAGDAGRQLTIVRRAPEYTMALLGGWLAGRHVTRQEYQAAHASADLMESWVRRILRQSRETGERRASSRSFDDVFERFARQALDGGVPVAAVVLSSPDAVFRPDLTQERITRLREHVRAADLVGRLGDGEIGVLLHDTPAAHADAAALRLEWLLKTAGDATPASMLVGVASRDPGETNPTALVQQARASMLPQAQ